MRYRYAGKTLRHIKYRKINIFLNGKMLGFGLHIFTIMKSNSFSKVSAMRDIKVVSVI